MCSLARPIYGGVGCCLCLHRVALPGQRAVLDENRALEIEPADLDALIRYVLNSGYEILPLDEVPHALSERRRRKFVVFTFDDGYVDNLSVALPIFRAHKAPLTIYVTTSFASQKGLVWWYLLERLFEQRDAVRFDDGTGECELPLATLEQKNRAFERIARHIRNCDQTKRDAFIEELLTGTGLDGLAISAKYMMGWDGIRELAADDLVTIGTHTVHHFTLNRLDPCQLRGEFVDSQRAIEDELQRPVRHLAYPFGGSNAVGEREFAAARDCGFGTAVTTRGANLFPEHRSFLHCLPRLGISGNYPIVSRFLMSESGVLSARDYGLRRVISD